MVFNLIGPAIGIGSSLLLGNNAKRASKKAAAAAQYGAEQQAQGIVDGLNASKTYYNQARADVRGGRDSAFNYLSPHISRGEEANNLLRQIIGLEGEEGQDEALGMYDNSPSAQLLKRVQEDAVRRTQGEFASGGMLRSGAMTESLGRRLSDMNLNNYYNWQGLSQNMGDRGFQASSQASNVAANSGVNLGRLASARGADYLTGLTNKGTALASGTIGAANARLAGSNAANNALGNALGRFSQTDFSGAFKGGGGGGGLGSWAPSIKRFG